MAITVPTSWDVLPANTIYVRFTSFLSSFLKMQHKTCIPWLALPNHLAMNSRYLLDKNFMAKSTIVNAVSVSKLLRMSVFCFSWLITANMWAFQVSMLFWVSFMSNSKSHSSFDVRLATIFKIWDESVRASFTFSQLSLLLSYSWL